MDNDYKYNPLENGEMLNTEQEKEFLKQHRTLTDFRIGLEVPDCLKARQIEGGTLLVETTYKMRA